MSWNVSLSVEVDLQEWVEDGIFMGLMVGIVVEGRMRTAVRLTGAC